MAEPESFHAPQCSCYIIWYRSRGRVLLSWAIWMSWPEVMLLGLSSNVLTTILVAPIPCKSLQICLDILWDSLALDALNQWQSSMNGRSWALPIASDSLGDVTEARWPLEFRSGWRRVLHVLTIGRGDTVIAHLFDDCQSILNPSSGYLLQAPLWFANSAKNDSEILFRKCIAWGAHNPRKHP